MIKIFSNTQISLAWLLAIALILAGCETNMAPLPNKRTTDIDGYKLEYATAGEGKPVIVFLNGFGCEMDESWNSIYPKAGNFGTVFAYNRLGTGKSDNPDQPQSATVIVDTLRKLLQKNALNPPYILVGHSAGGLYANLFARQHPHEVAGVVLVDTPAPDRETMWQQQSNNLQYILDKAVWNVFDWFTPARLMPEWMPMFAESAQQIQDAGPFPNIPLIVITAGIDNAPFWAPGRTVRRKIHLDGQRLLASMSQQGKQIVAEKSSHFVMSTEPELVIRAIREVDDKKQR